MAHLASTVVVSWAAEKARSLWRLTWWVLWCRRVVDARAWCNVMNGWGLGGHVMEACALDRCQVKMLAWIYGKSLRK